MLGHFKFEKFQNIKNKVRSGIWNLEWFQYGGQIVKGFASWARKEKRFFFKYLAVIRY